MNVKKKTRPEEHHYEVLSGRGIITGKLFGGCLDLLPMIVGTEIWPECNEWKNKILLVETSEEKPNPDLVLYYLRNLGAQGILNQIRGIVVGKPQDEQYYEEYKGVYRAVLNEFNCQYLPVLYNVNIGHAVPTGILPLGIECEIDLDKKTIRLLESATAL